MTEPAATRPWFHCDCFNQYEQRQPAQVPFHAERQDTTAPGWLRLLDLVEEAAADGREEFAPLRELTRDERFQVVTLPATIARLTRVRHFILYASDLVRIPPEIGAMSSLEIFTPYVSSRLHWFPYEITRCAKLWDSTVSTRSLFGNYKMRPPFPALQPGRADVAGLDLAHLDPAVWGAESASTCSVCDRPLAAAGLHQVWISLRVATDVLPLLVNACSPECVAALPPGDHQHVDRPHTGGPGVVQPPTSW